MKNLKATVLLSTVLLSGAAFAQQKAPTPDWTVSGNATLMSDYRFRGFTQTGFGPALQGGIDIAHKDGFYVGNWNSNVANTLFNGATLEMDLYGGYKGTAGPLGFDVGAIYYAYPRSGKLFPGAVKIDNKEIYGGLSYGPVSAKLYYALGDYFKTAAVFAAPQSTKGTTYLDLSYSQEFSGFTVGAHYGYLTIKNNNQPTITNAAIPAGALPKNIADWKLSVGKDVYNGYVLTGALVGTSKKFAFPNGNFGDTGAAGKTALLLSVGKTF
jgi:uncharacterized protein (TIGR02001 family)